MKKDMFYNYDYHINKKEYPYNEIVKENNDLTGYSGQWLVYDYAGKCIGLRVYKNAPINLHFDFEGSVDGCCAIDDFLNNNTLTIELNDAFHNTFIKKDIYGEINNGCLDIELLDEENKLKKDTYYIHLYVTLETGEIYNLFNEADGFVSII